VLEFSQDVLSRLRRIAAAVRNVLDACEDDAVVDADLVKDEVVW
jgi:hypothetical protein